MACLLVLQGFSPESPALGLLLARIDLVLEY
jgi:hypothetical protein